MCIPPQLSIFSGPLQLVSRLPPEAQGAVAEADAADKLFDSEAAVFEGVESVGVAASLIGQIDIQRSVPQEDLIDAEIPGGIVVLPAEALPVRFVRLRDRQLLHGPDRLGLFILCDGPHALIERVASLAVQPVPAVEDHEGPVRVDKVLEPGFEAGHAAAVIDGQAEFGVVFDAPAEAVAVVSVLLVVGAGGLAAVEQGRGEHDPLLLEGEDFLLPQRPVPGQHVEYGG